MEIRVATDQDWPSSYPLYSTVMDEGRTYAFPAVQTLEEARPWWMEQPPGATIVAVENGKDRRLGHDGPEPPRPRCPRAPLL